MAEITNTFPYVIGDGDLDEQIQNLVEKFKKPLKGTNGNLRFNSAEEIAKFIAMGQTELHKRIAKRTHDDIATLRTITHNSIKSSNRLSWVAIFIATGTLLWTAYYDWASGQDTQHLLSKLESQNVIEVEQAELLKKINAQIWNLRVDVDKYRDATVSHTEIK